MKNLKALHFVRNGDEYQVIGIYRNTGLPYMTTDPEYSTAVLDHGKDYNCIRATLKKLAQANNVEPFDFVSAPLVESLAKMKRG